MMSRRAADILRLTPRQREILNALVNGYKDYPADYALVRTEAGGFYLGHGQCTRAARALLWKGLIEPQDPDGYTWCSITEFGRKALADPSYVPPFAYVALGLPMPDDKRRELDPRYTPAGDTP